MIPAVTPGSLQQGRSEACDSIVCGSVSTWNIENFRFPAVKPLRPRGNIIAVRAGGFSGRHAAVLSRFGPLCGYLEVTVGKKA
jgi:hypothetical protein